MALLQYRPIKKPPDESYNIALQMANQPTINQPSMNGPSPSVPGASPAASTNYQNPTINSPVNAGLNTTGLNLGGTGSVPHHARSPQRSGSDGFNPISGLPGGFSLPTNPALRPIGRVNNGSFTPAPPVQSQPSNPINTGVGSGSPESQPNPSVMTGQSSQGGPDLNVDYNGDGKIDDLDFQIARQLADARSQEAAALSQQQLGARAQAGRYGLAGSGALQAQINDNSNVANRDESQVESGVITSGIQRAIQLEDEARKTQASKEAQYNYETQNDIDSDGDGFVGDPALNHRVGKLGGNYGDGNIKNNYDINDSNDPNNPLSKNPDGSYKHPVDGNQPTTPKQSDTQSYAASHGLRDGNNDGLDDATGQKMPDSSDPNYGKSVKDIANEAQDYPPFVPFFGKYVLGSDAKYNYYEGTDGKIWRFPK